MTYNKLIKNAFVNKDKIFTFFSLPAAAKSLLLCPTLVWPHKWQPTRLRRPWDSPGKNTGVGCHFLLQCMKVKSEWRSSVDLAKIWLLRLAFLWTWWYCNLITTSYTNNLFFNLFSVSKLFISLSLCYTMTLSMLLATLLIIFLSLTVCDQASNKCNDDYITSSNWSKM